MTRPEGFAVWITGIPASGKSTVARELVRKLNERGIYPALLYMRAGLTMLKRLAAGAPAIYPGIARAGERLRRGIEKAFEAAGFPARATGDGNAVVPGSSLFMVHFPRDKSVACDRPEDVHDDRRSNVALREEILKLALLVNVVNIVHGGGAVSAAHGAKEIDATIAAYGEAARLFKKYLG